MVSRKVVAIAGSSASGKTQFKHELAREVKNVSVLPISLDCVYKTPSAEDLKNIKNYDFDHPNAFDWLLLVQTVKTILAQIDASEIGDTLEYELPHYDFTTHKRDGMRRYTMKIEGHVVLIIEGIFGLHHPEIRELADVRIFIDSDEKTRIFRRIIRDLLFRKRDILSIALQTLQFVEPAYEALVKPTRAHASLVVPNHITTQEIKNVMKTLQEMGCENFTAEEMIRTVLGKEETFIEGCGDQFLDAVKLIAAYLSIV